MKSPHPQIKSETLPECTPSQEILEESEATLLDVVDNLLDHGVMVHGDIVLGLAGVDLVYLRLSLLLCAADRIMPKADA